MRTVGIIFLSLTPLLLGLDYRSTLKKRKDFILIFKEFIIFVKEQIRFCGRERDEILSLALRDPRFNIPIFKRMEKALKDGENIAKIFENNNDIRIKSQEITQVSTFISELGKSDYEGQMSHCDYYISVFDKLGQKLSDSYSARSRLALGLTLSLGAVMFIIMI